MLGISFLHLLNVDNEIKVVDLESLLFFKFYISQIKEASTEYIYFSNGV